MRHGVVRHVKGKRDNYVITTSDLNMMLHKESQHFHKTCLLVYIPHIEHTFILFGFENITAKILFAFSIFS